MDPNALRERKWTFGKITARQSVGVLGDGPRAYLHVVTTFSLPIGDNAFAHHAGSSHVEFADAEMLTDEGKREALALEHMAKLASDLRFAAGAMSIELAERAAADAKARKEALAS